MCLGRFEPEILWEISPAILKIALVPGEWMGLGHKRDTGLPFRGSLRCQERDDGGYGWDWRGVDGFQVLVEIDSARPGREGEGAVREGFRVPSFEVHSTTVKVSFPFSPS